MARFNHPRLQREADTVAHMIGLYCSSHHAQGPLCAACTKLLDTALDRLATCPFGAGKPACRHCRIHCYPKGYGEQIREVMRYAGPRLVWHHPLLAILHLWDAWNERDDS